MATLGERRLGVRSGPDRGVSVGITNSRLATAKRGIAVEVATELASATDAPVCLVGADPTDRDVERHLAQLGEIWGRPRMDVTQGTHHLEVARFPRSRVCVVSISDREGVELLFPTLQETFGYLVVDTPSRTGLGVGIANMLLDWLDAVLVTTGVTAGELAETRRYVERLETATLARDVDVRVLAIGEPDGGGLDHGQLGTRLAHLPTIGHVPRLGGGVAHRQAIVEGRLADAFSPVIRWITSERPVDLVASDPVWAEAAGTDRHIANRIYRETLD